MILRDPIHGLIAFEGDLEKLIKLLLNTYELQRLRRIKQLGLIYFAFPGAEHSRFSHALGTTCVMMKLQERIRRIQHQLPQDLRMDKEAERDSIAAALLHDLGHGPFSHLFEEVGCSQKDHELWTQMIITDSSTQVHRALESISKGMAFRVAGLLAGRYRLMYLAKALSGSFDVDRADYLLRDSLLTGVRYGIYDLEWLLNSLCFIEIKKDITSQWLLGLDGHKGLPPIEAFFAARHYMYQQVYYHKTARAGESLIKGMFIRLKEIMFTVGMSTTIPSSIKKIFCDDGISLIDYLNLDDALLIALFSTLERSSDPVLSELASQFQGRVLPKTISLISVPKEKWNDMFLKTKEIVSKHCKRADLKVWLDLAGKTKTSSSLSINDEGQEPLWVMMNHKKLKKAEDISTIILHLKKNQIFYPRLIFPYQLRDIIVRALDI